MAGYADRFKSPEEQLPLTFACLEPLRDICPSVRELFTGVYDDEGTELVKSASLTFFLDGNRLKFVIRPKSHGECCWGIVLDVRHPFESVDVALTKGECEWKESKLPPMGSTPAY